MRGEEIGPKSRAKQCRGWDSNAGLCDPHSGDSEPLAYCLLGINANIQDD